MNVLAASSQETARQTSRLRLQETKTRERFVFIVSPPDQSIVQSVNVSSVTEPVCTKPCVNSIYGSH